MISAASRHVEGRRDPYDELEKKITDVAPLLAEAWPLIFTDVPPVGLSEIDQAKVIIRVAEL